MRRLLEGLAVDAEEQDKLFPDLRFMSIGISVVGGEFDLRGEASRLRVGKKRRAPEIFDGIRNKDDGFVAFDPRVAPRGMRVVPDQIVRTDFPSSGVFGMKHEVANRVQRHAFARRGTKPRSGEA